MSATELNSQRYEDETCAAEMWVLQLVADMRALAHVLGLDLSTTTQTPWRFVARNQWTRRRRTSERKKFNKMRRAARQRGGRS